jgi:hypothetical protein
MPHARLMGLIRFACGTAFRLRIRLAPVTGDSAVEWESRNPRVIDQRRITGRTREAPTVAMSCLM